MKTQEELIALKEEVENLSKKLQELNDEELEAVCGGIDNLPTGIRVPDTALQRALNQEAAIGAVRYRLDYTGGNHTTNGEA